MTHLGQLIEKLSVVWPWSERKRTAVVHGRRNQNGTQSPVEGSLTMANLNTPFTLSNTGDL